MSTRTTTAVPTTPRAPASGHASVPADHVRLGVGARFTVVPAADDPVPIILGALAAGRAAFPGLDVTTDDVSSLVRGSEQDLAGYLTTVVAHATRATPSGHLVATVGLSRGCPGQLECDLTADDLVVVPPVRLEAAGVRAAAHWALYALGSQDTMGPIGRAVEQAREQGTWTRAENFVTRLDGDLAAVIATLVDTWATVGSQVPHVTAHATISLGSPTAQVPGSAQTATSAQVTR